MSRNYLQGENLRLSQDASEAILRAKTLEAQRIQQGYHYRTFYDQFGKPYRKLTK